MASDKPDTAWRPWLRSVAVGAAVTGLALGFMAVAIGMKWPVLMPMDLVRAGTTCLVVCIPACLVVFDPFEWRRPAGPHQTIIANPAGEVAGACVAAVAFGVVCLVS